LAQIKVSEIGPVVLLGPAIDIVALLKFVEGPCAFWDFGETQLQGNLCCFGSFELYIASLGKNREP
jgi:hypothetical protein